LIKNNHNPVLFEEVFNYFAYKPCGWGAGDPRDNIATTLEEVNAGIWLNSFQ
jgi:hypothetical protein